MAQIKLIVQLIEDDGARHQNELDIPLSDFKDPDLVNEEDMIHAFNSTFGFLMKSALHFVKYWRASVASKDYFENIEQYARDRGMGDIGAAAMVAGAISSSEGTSHLQLPIQVLEPQEGEDFPRPRFPNRYTRKPVI